MNALLLSATALSGFVPLDEAQGPYAGMLAASVFIQEVARIGVWFMHRRVWMLCMLAWSCRLL